MNNPVISIVAPVFNVEKYLPSFIDSILSQTYTQWELILVDDGSTDSSSDICDKYARIDKRLRVIHQMNRGVSAARNAGIRTSKGTWLMLPDSDDIVAANALERMLSFTDDDVDLVSAGYQRYVLGKFISEKHPSETRKMPVKEYVEKIGMSPKARNIDRYCWNKLFRLSVIKQNCIYYHEDIFFREDVLYVYQYLLRCRSNVMTISDSVYSYFMRPTSAAKSLTLHYSSKSCGKFYSMTRCYDILEQMDEVSIDTKRRMKAEILSAYNAVSRLIGDDKRWKNDKQAMDVALRKYYNRKELTIFRIKRICRKLVSIVTNKN